MLLGLGKVRRGTARHEHIALLHGHAIGVHVVDVEAATHALIDRLSKLTLANSSSSDFTLRTMAVVSLIIPFVVAYIAYFWRQMDKRSLTTEELNQSEKY
mgnify:CR=1 FL=1